MSLQVIQLNPHDRWFWVVLWGQFVHRDRGVGLRRGADAGSGNWYTGCGPCLGPCWCDPAGVLGMAGDPRLPVPLSASARLGSAGRCVDARRRYSMNVTGQSTMWPRLPEAIL